MNSWTEYDPQFVRQRYNRLASIYVFFEWFFWMPRGIRPRAVERLNLKPGDRVLEVGCGTGRNLSYLSRAVGPDGRVYGVDISEGMLAKAREACEKNGCTNVRLIQSDAAEYELPELVDGAIFSLSYCTMRHRKLALRHAWEQLKSGGRLVMLDAKTLSGWLGRLLYPLAVWTLKLTVLGSPDIDELKDLEALAGDLEVENLQFGTYFIARVTKPAQ
jgi:demethylmenaquinone methyltransferase/2-methoxy-6-polyprenyl-1,4-benzoquinol methylase